MSEYTLEIVEGPEAGRQVPLSASEPLEIGREPGVGFELTNDDLVSRRHARLTPTTGGVIVEDLESRNGTFVNGDEIQTPAYLAPGSQLLIGVTVFELRTAAQAAGATAVRPIPSNLTALRPLPTPQAAVSPPRAAPAAPPAPAPSGPRLAAPARTPDYVPDDLVPRGRLGSQLDPLLDIHTKSKARAAPLAIIVLVAIVVIIFLAVR
jgi:Inner membrane component of T3SS, cytoplasmic domain